MNHVRYMGQFGHLAVFLISRLKAYISWNKFFRAQYVGAMHRRKKADSIEASAVPDGVALFFMHDFKLRKWHSLGFHVIA